MYKRHYFCFYRYQITILIQLSNRNQYFRNMMERNNPQMQPVMRNSFHVTSKIKENMIPVNHQIEYQGSYRTANNFHLSQRPANIDQLYFVKANSPVVQTRVVSPMNMVSSVRVTSNRKPQFIELGGNKQKRTSRDKSTVQLEQSRRIEPSINELNLRKISMLEGRIMELQKQKQYIATQLNEKVNNFQYQIARLNQVIKAYDQKHTQSIFVEQTKQEKTQSVQVQQTNEEFNFQDMLSQQININLELREELEKIKQENESYNLKLQQIQANFKNIYLEHSAQAQKWKAQLNNLSCQNNKLQLRIQQMESNQSKRQNSIQELIQEKQKRILQLQEQLFSYDSSLKVKEYQINQLSQEISSYKLNDMNNMDQIEQLTKKVHNLSEEKKQSQCKKCKQYKSTIFRLSNQLNKK